MRIKNDKEHFGVISVLLHWIMAIIIISMLAIGLYMVDLPSGNPKFELYGWHKAFGILVLMLATLRLLWRMSNTTPALELPWYERLGARFAHFALYLLMICMPLSGWLMSSAGGYPTSFFGLFNLPNLVAPNEELHELFEEIHEWLAYGLISLIVIHTLGALKHHFIDKDNILKRMCSWK